MTPFDPTPGDDIDVDLGMGVTVNVDVDEEAATAQAPVGRTEGEPDPDEEPAMSYLVKFAPDVTPAKAEAVLGRLSPPGEGIILAGSGAVIVRAGQAFVDQAEREDCVRLVNAVRTKTWEPNRHQVLADPD